MWCALLAPELERLQLAGPGLLHCSHSPPGLVRQYTAVGADLANLARVAATLPSIAARRLAATNIDLGAVEPLTKLIQPCRSNYTP